MEWGRIYGLHGIFRYIYGGKNRDDMSLWHGSALLYLFYLHHMATIHHTFIAHSDMPQTDIVQSDTDWDR